MNFPHLCNVLQNKTNQNKTKEVKRNKTNEKNAVQYIGQHFLVDTLNLAINRYMKENTKMLVLYFHLNKLGILFSVETAHMSMVKKC